MSTHCASQLLIGLGRPTKRGVKKCPRCGTINGIRGLSCKSRDCDMIFKDVTKKRKYHLECCRLITDSTSTVLFSVKLRERGPEQRGLVKFDICRSSTSMLLTELNIAKATCHVHGCSWSSTSEGFCCELSCVHVATCLQTLLEPKEAQPLPVKHSVLNAMSISADWKHKIWLRARKDGPLAQRVSLTTMVVKCESDDRHPLGYLHMVFVSGDEDVCKFGCACNLLEQPSTSSRKSFTLPRMHPSNSPEANRCIHFYSCMAVFLSDSSLCKEFSTFISDDQLATEMDTVLDSNADMSMTVDPQLDVFTTRELIRFDDPLQIQMETSDGDIQTVSLPVISGALANEAVVKALSELTNTQVHAPVPNPEGIHLFQPEPILNPVPEVGSKPPSDSSEFVFEDLNSVEKPLPEVNVVWTAIDWIATITESVNQTMHYGFSGTPPNILTFQAPQKFFDVLRDRISLSGLQKSKNSAQPKKRLPNSTLVVTRKNELPLGTFTTNIWKLTNILQVKRIFDTPLAELEVSRKFIRGQGGTYEYIPNNKFAQIKPGSSLLVFKTYLKVGQMTGDRTELTPFVLEWTPNILHRSKVGQLVVKFEFGQQKNESLILPSRF